MATLLSLLWLIAPFLPYPASATNTVKNGVVGYGINMYKPVCCYACHDSLSSLYLNCTTFMSTEDDGTDSMGMDMKLKSRFMLRKRMDMGGGDDMAMTSDECRASDTAWLQTLAYCVHNRCTQDGVSEHLQNRCFGDQAAGGLSVPNLREAFPLKQPSIEVADDAVWLNATSLVNSALWERTYETLSKFEFSEDMHTKYSLIIWLTTMAVCLVVGSYTWIISHSGSLLHPRGPATSSSRNHLIVTAKKTIKQRVLLPALFGNRHLTSLPYNAGYMPSRVLSLFIALYVVLNIIFCCVDYPLALPNTWWTETRRQVAAYVGNRTGVLSFANLGIAILFAGRNNILIWITGWSQTTFLTLHRWASRVATVQAIVHSIVYTVVYFWEDPNGSAKSYYAEAAKAYYWWGIIATVALGIMLGLAVLPIRLGWYEFFLITHIALAILALVGSWYHVDLRYKKQWGYEVWLYLCFAFWGFDRLVRIIRVALFNNWPWISSQGFGSSSVKLHSTQPPRIPRAAQIHRLPNTDIVQLTLFPGRHWQIAIRPGMHTFLYFPASGKFWESHPFTIADWGFLKGAGGSVEEPHHSERVSSEMDVAERDVHHGKTTQIITTATFADRTITNWEGAKDSLEKEDKYDTGTFYLRFLLRVRQGTTKSLLHLDDPAPQHGSSRTSGLVILTEGPYAGHMQTLYPLLTADTVLCIAGGIGVTFALGFVKNYLASRKSSGKTELMHRTTRFILAWSAREAGLIGHVDSMLAEYAPDAEDRDSISDTAKQVEYKVWYTGGEKQSLPPHQGQYRKNDPPGVEGVDDTNEKVTNSIDGPYPSSPLAPPCRAADSLSDDSSLKDVSAIPFPRTFNKTLVRGSRMPVSDVLNSSLEVGHRTAVLVCAPGEMADDVRKAVVEATGKGLDVDLIEEAFAW
ncbi:Ferric/cupric reductase transmembrane component B [Exophiala dermatitidis]